jgi:uncharacterized damage-inducible protein DinB
MNLQDLNTLLDYHYWARDRMFEALAPLSDEQLRRDLGGSFGTIHDTLGHLVGAEMVWAGRWRGIAFPGVPKGSTFADLAAIRAAWLELEPRIREFVNNLGEAGVDRVFEYKLFSGETGSSPFWQMLQHLVNHGSYHRGQVTDKLRQLGAEPAKSMDMIAFYRARV